jgi:hypothetical protein
MAEKLTVFNAHPCAITLPSSPSCGRMAGQ